MPLRQLTRFDTSAAGSTTKELSAIFADTLRKIRPTVSWTDVAVGVEKPNTYAFLAGRQELYSCLY
jgi:hypothetical protein